MESASGDRVGELLQQSRTGDRAAMMLLVQRYWPALRAFARARMSSELRAHESGSDLVQGAVLALLQRLDGFEYRGEEAFRGWLFGALQNELLHHERDLRAQKRDVRRLAAGQTDGDALTLAQCYSKVLSPSRGLMAQEDVAILESAMDTLPDDYREVIALSRLARLSRAEVARQMGRTEDSVRNLLHRALVALAEAVRRLGGTPG